MNNREAVEIILAFAIGAPTLTLGFAVFGLWLWRKLIGES